MTRAFSIKRRKQDTHKPDGQSSQRSVLGALGIGVGRSSPHVASKPGHIHVTDPAPEVRFARAQEWHAATGRPLPPHMRARRPLPEPAPMSTHDRAAHYGVTGKDAAAILNDPALSTPQRRRALHKAGQHGERPAGFTPAARLAHRPPRPRGIAKRRRARKNAAQQARHAAKAPA
jgi:hypothetical protein